MNASVSSEKKAGKTNILVGVKGSKQYVDSQFGTTSAGLFDKLDSYALKSDKGTISILGKDTDAAFYGLTSLYHIFKQVEGKKLETSLSRIMRMLQAVDLLRVIMGIHGQQKIVVN